MLHPQLKHPRLTDLSDQPPKSPNTSSKKKRDSHKETMSKRSRSLSSSPSLDYSPLQSYQSSRPSSPASSSTAAAPSKIPHLQSTADPAVEVMRCSLPPHRETLSFTSYADYEVHYRQAHVNRCVECGRNFPTGRFLDLHIEENHDPLIAAKKDRGEKTYGCFIEDCERKCSTPQKRRMHLIDKHMFPRTYNFFIVNDGIDKQTSLLRPTNAHGKRRLSATPTSPQEGRLRNRQSSVSHQPDLSSSHQPQTAAAPGKRESDDMEISELEKSMSALRFVPASVMKSQGGSKNRS